MGGLGYKRVLSTVVQSILHFERRLRS